MNIDINSDAESEKTGNSEVNQSDRSTYITEKR